MSRVFGHGALRLYLLSLLEDEPRHGYELIRLMEDRFMGLYTPSAGTVYPRLAALEEMGLVAHEERDGRKVYRLTDAGREELNARREEVDAIVAQAVRSASELAREIRDEVRSSVRDLRAELREAVRDVKREERRISRDAQHSARAGAHAARDAERAAREVARDASRTARTLARDLVRRPDVVRAEVIDQDDVDDVLTMLRSLRRDLESFVADVVAAARQHRLDGDRLRSVRDALLDARGAVLEALTEDPKQPR